MRSRLSIGHLPGFDSAITACTGQLQTESSRTGTRSILQIGHVPFLSSRTSGCIGQVHDSGGRLALCGAVGRAVCGAAATADTSAMANRRAAIGLMTSVLCYTPSHASQTGVTASALCSAALLILAGLAAHPAQSAEAAARGENLEGASLDAFLAAPSREAAAQLVDGLIKGGIGFDDAYRALQRGRSVRPGEDRRRPAAQRDLGWRRASLRPERPRHLRSGAPVPGALPAARRRRRPRDQRAGRRPARSARSPARSRSTSSRTRGTPRPGGATIRC